MFIKFILYNITVMFKDLSVYTGCFYSQQILIIHIPI